MLDVAADEDAAVRKSTGGNQDIGVFDRCAPPSERPIDLRRLVEHLGGEGEYPMPFAESVEEPQLPVMHLRHEPAFGFVVADGVEGEVVPVSQGVAEPAQHVGVLFEKCGDGVGVEGIAYLVGVYL